MDEPVPNRPFRPHDSEDTNAKKFKHEEMTQQTPAVEDLRGRFVVGSSKEPCLVHYASGTRLLS